MKFKINNSNWEIREIPQSDIEYRGGQQGYYTHGYTCYSENIIYINETSPEKIRTLKHELCHCWLYMYGHCQDNKEFSNEDVCEIVASSNDFINETVKNYIEYKMPTSAKHSSRASMLKENRNGKKYNAKRETMLSMW